jgi:pyridoxal phosphate enzyme (YggS family)
MGLGLQRKREEIQRNRERITARIEEAALRVGRDPDTVRLMAVTKTLPESTVRLAVESGVRLFGENRVQEAVEKYRELRADVELHLIGHLQRNKARVAAGFFDWVESIDKSETADHLNRRAVEVGKQIGILLEVNTSGEESKYGVRNEDELWDLVERITPMDHLRIRGLMTVGPFTDDEKRLRFSFSLLRRLFEKAKDRFPHLSLDTLSMGMSNDYEIAVEEGSSLVRIGTALFGPREEL